MRRPESSNAIGEPPTGDMVDEKHEGIQSVDRAMRILHAFSMERPELSVSDIATVLGTHPSTSSRLASTLASWGLLAKNPETGKYWLGVRLVVLAGLVVQHADLHAVARPILFELRDITKERVNLTILDGDEAINLENIPGLFAVQDVGWVGRRTPIHCTATGRAILAYAPEARARELIAKGLPRLTPKTMCDGEALLCKLREVRTLGYAVNEEEFEIGLCSVAAPIWNHLDQVEASVSVSGPVYRMAADGLPELGALLKDKTMEISRAIGYVAKSSRPKIS